MSGRSEIYRTSVDPEKKHRPLVMAFHYMDRPSATVLDVGCACGDLGIALKNYKGYGVYGIELDAESAEVARKTGAYAWVGRMNLDELSPASLPEFAGKFDYVVCGDVLEHLRDPIATITVLKGFLKDDGRLIASIPNVAHMSVKANLLVNDFTYTDSGLLDRTHIHFFTHRSICEGMSASGLEIEECQFTFQKKLGWQPGDPYAVLPPEIQRYVFSDWHSNVCQYVLKMAVSRRPVVDLLSVNARKLRLDESNAPEVIRKYRRDVLENLPPSPVEERVRCTQSMLKEVEQRNHALLEERAALRQEVAERQRGERVLQENVMAANDSLSDVCGKLAVKEHVLSVTRADLDRAESELKDMQGLLSVKEHVLSVVRDDLEKAESGLKDAQGLLIVKEHVLSVARCDLDQAKEELRTVRDELAAKDDLVSASKAAEAAVAKSLAVVRGDLAARSAALDAARRQCVSLRDQVVKSTHCANEQKQIVASLRKQVAALESQSLSRKLRRLVKALLPYGAVCRWKQMAYGICEDRPLMYYPGFGKRARRVLKFALPYGAVKLFKRLKYRK